MKQSEKAYDKIKNMIFDNHFAINEIVLFSKIAEICNCSVTPVKEAVIRLQEEGLVEIVPRHGIKISPLSKQDVIFIYEVLGYLEISAIDLCIQHGLKEKQLETLQGYVDKMDEALQKNDLESWYENDQSFHKTLFQYSKNPYLLETYTKYSLKEARCGKILLKIRSIPKDSVREHQLVLEAIKCGDVLNVRETHLQHWKDISANFVEFLDQYNFLGN